MGHQITIEGDEAFTLATELAALTGESLEAAVTQAVRDKVRLERQRQAKVAHILEIGRSFRALLGDNPTLMEIDSLYDPETGLPA